MQLNVESYVSFVTDDEWIRTNLNRWTKLHTVRAIFSNSAFAVMVSRLVF